MGYRPAACAVRMRHAYVADTMPADTLALLLQRPAHIPIPSLRAACAPFQSTPPDGIGFLCAAAGILPGRNVMMGREQGMEAPTLREIESNA